jgi:SanA protein
LLWIAFFFTVFLNLVIRRKYGDLLYDEQTADPDAAAVVLGAKPGRNGELTAVLEDRLSGAVFLYRNRKIKRVIITGRSESGSGRAAEIDIMKSAIMDMGVPEHHLYVDNEGHTTYRSLSNLKEIHGDGPYILCTQKFHLSRSLYLARSMGLDAAGYICDRRKYGKRLLFWLREKIATVKAFAQILIRKSRDSKRSRGEAS